MKDAPRYLFLQTAIELKKECNKFDATFIINDNVNIAKEINADGVHIGKDDMSIAEARIILGENKIIGATCNTIEDLLFANEKGADYIGLGPYKHTTTKEKLSAILGIDGYKIIMKTMQEQDISIPIVAIGGIKLEDVADLMMTRVNGIAVSGGILEADDITKKVQDFLKIINK